MGYLSEELKNYYKKNGNKISFINGENLNQLALQMWENLGFQEIDSSVLSRVINGKRLFTVAQLEVFCTILKIDNSKKIDLLYSLNRDYSERYNLDIDSLFIPKNNIIEIVQRYTADMRLAYLGGDSARVVNMSNILEPLLNLLVRHPSRINEKVIGNLFAYNLYIRTENLTSFVSPEYAIQITMGAANKLFALGHRFQNTLMLGYANCLLANAYYIAGGYSFSKSRYSYYNKSIQHGKRALAQFPIDSDIRLFVLRNIAASATYLKNINILIEILNQTKQVLFKQPQQNLANALHLSWTLSRGLALSGQSNSLKIVEDSLSYFKKDLSNMGIYEISCIKMEVETLLVLGTSDKRYLQQRVIRGIQTADKDNFERHKEYFQETLHAF